MKSKGKSELAEMAGVSERTLRRWLKQHKEKLKQMGVEEHSKVIPPRAVQYICEAYGIEMY